MSSGIGIVLVFYDYKMFKFGGAYIINPDLLNKVFLGTRPD